MPVVLATFTFSRRKIIDQAPVVRRSDNAIHWINLFPVDNAINFAITYPLDSDLSVG